MKNNKILNYILALGHACSDINQGALAAVLPFLIAAHNYDYTTAATLVMFSNIVGSVVQPIFGQLADKKNKPWVICFGLLMAGGGMALTGFISNFFGLCIAVMISGVGIAMFHPQAAKLVNNISDKNNKGKGISVFSFGGSLGSSLGPIMATCAISLFGLKGTLIFIVPEIIFCIIMLSACRGNDAFEEHINNEAVKINEDIEKVDQWSSFIRLSIAVFGRSIVLNGLNTFLCLYWISTLGKTEAAGNLMLSIFYGIGAVSTLIGGRLADKYGYQNMIKISFCIALPAIVLLSITTNVYIAITALLPLGASLSMSYSPLVVLGQQYLPNRVGFASGVTLGLAVSVGGIFAPVLGSIADQFGVVGAIYAIAIVSVIPVVVSFFLPPVVEKK